MNIFNQSDVVITKINAKKLHQPLGYDLVVAEYRNKSTSPTGFYTLSLVLDGESEYIFSNRTIHAKKDDIVFLDNYTPFRQKSINDYWTYTINFVATGGLINEPNIFHPRNVEKYTSIFKEAASLFNHKKPGYHLYLTSTLYKILATIKADDINEGIHESKMDKFVLATDYIKLNLSNYDLSVEDIAENLKISSVYLRKIFMETSGMTPLAYIKNLRINTASDLFIAGLSSVSEAAKECGFRDTSYFCREFKKIFNCTPLSFKKKSTYYNGQG